MNIKCIVCGTEKEATRSDQKFCSPKCRVTFSRNTKSELSVTEPQKIATSGEATFTKGLNEYDSKMKLYDTFSASELVLAGVRPPKWKKRFKTNGEALMACREVLKKDLGIEYIIKEEDYSKWK